MLFRKLLRTFLRYKAQFISMIVMVVLGVGIFAGFNAEWYSIEKDTNYFYEKTNFASYRIYYKSGYFSKDDVDNILKIDGISKASRFMSFNTEESKEKDTIEIAVSENFTVSNFTLLSGEEYDLNCDDGIWLSKKYSEANNYNIGDKIILTYTSVTKEFIIKGIIQSSEYLIHNPDGALMPNRNKLGYAYITPKAYEQISNSLFGAVIYYQINVISTLEKEDISNKLDSLFNTTLQIVPKENVVSYSECKGEAEEGKSMGLWLPVIFLVIAILTMVTTMNRLTSNEKTQIGILKALGFKNRRIIWHYTSYALFIGLLGSILGLALGYLVAFFIFSENTAMGTYFEMPVWTIHMPWFVYFGAVAIILFLGLIGFLSVRKTLKGSAADALRPYTPKSMKNLFIEKTKTFHKLNFATRWNLRDSFRHKARSLMSVFGVFGCTLLLFASFGMKSTLDEFVEVYYNQVMNYETKINLSETISNTDIKNLIQTYEADSSATVATKVSGDTYVMTIFNNENDRYRLLGTDNIYLKNISNEGVYICRRMSEKLKLNANDTLSFSLYGKNTVYKLKIAGVVNNNIEGFEVSEEYIKTINLEYKMDTLYTNTLKEDVIQNDNISVIQSKTEIMETFEDFISIMNSMVFLLVVFSAVLAFVVLYNLGTMSLVERYRELATLKVLGFKNRKIRNILISQNVVFTILGIIIGIPTGYAVVNVLFKLLASDYELLVYCDAMAYIVSVIFTLLVSLCVSYLTSLKIKKINMVEALKQE